MSVEVPPILKPLKPLFLSRSPQNNSRLNRYTENLEMGDFESNLTVPSLVGPANYRHWSKTFQNAARARGLWTLFSGEEKIVDKPAKLSKEDVLELTNDRANTQVLLYRLDLDEYNAQQKRIQQAIIMIQSCCDAVIGNNFPTYEDPAAAWKHLEMMYRPSNEAVLARARRAITKIYYSDYSNISHYVLAIQKGKKDIEDAGGTLSDAQAEENMTFSLPDELHGYLNYSMSPSQDADMEQPSLEEYCRRLISYDYLKQCQKFKG